MTAARPTPAGAGVATTGFDVALARGVLAVLRFADAAHIAPAARACAAGGVLALEVTMTTPGALDAIDALRRDPTIVGAGAVVGAGSVLDARAAAAALHAGAGFVVSPVFAPDVVARCRHHGVPAVPAGFTPSELAAAAALEGAAVKLFPAAPLGPGYVADVRAPMPHLRLVPTGGVTLATAAAWMRAGAVAVGVGSALAEPALVAAGRLDEITARARAFVEAVAGGRPGRGTP
jgi:2-dehydro-3-deoxyphosphogluconate aldolase/(4S)-4-hydroxy-2-oxoglutarate aldolase